MNQELGSINHFTPGNPVIYPPNSSSTQFDETSPSSVHSRECEISRDSAEQLRQEGTTSREADCTIVEDTDLNPDNSALDQFIVSSKFQCPEEAEPGFKRSLSKKISIRSKSCGWFISFFEVLIECYPLQLLSVPYYD